MGALSDILIHGSEALNWAACAQQLQGTPDANDARWLAELGTTASELKATAALPALEQEKELHRLASNAQLLRRIEQLRTAAQKKLTTPDPAEDSSRRRRAIELTSLLRLLQRHAP